MQAYDISPPIPRPFLKWAGGKGQLLRQYESFFPQTFSTYHEPFLGGGAVFFHLQFQRRMKKAWLMDINPELVNTFCCVRNHATELIHRLETHRDRHSPEYYYAIRAQSEGSELDRAARLMYLNKTCFNGLYRQNRKGQFNVPLGSYKNPAICDPHLILTASHTLKFAQIATGTFESVLKRAKGPMDFVYFDPPYHPLSSTSKFTNYHGHAFTEADQIRLRDTVVKLARRGVKVMVSNSDCEFIRDLYQDFSIHTIYASRSINVNAERRGKITEVLVTTY